MKTIAAVLAAGSAAVVMAAAPVPTVSNVRLAQDSNTRKVTINYDLADADAVVTVILTTNGVPVAGAHLQGMQGDVATVVAKGTGRTITWKPNKFWPEGGRIEGEIAARVTAWPVESPSPYMVVSLDGTKVVRYYETEDALPGGIGDSAYRTTKMVFRKIPAATACYRAGSDVKETGRSTSETVHYVTLTNDFYLAVFPLTQGQYMTISGSAATNPSSTIGDNLPVDNLSGAAVGFPYGTPIGRTVSFDASSLVGKARNATGFTALGCPTQAEWEFACRAGSNEPVYGGYTLDEVAWYVDNSGGTLQPVGQKKPNAFGLYDMLGNVSERVNESYLRTAYAAEVVDPCDMSNSWGSYQAMCGGTFKSAASVVRAAGWTCGGGSGNGEARYYYYTEPGFGVRFSLRLK